MIGKHWLLRAALTLTVALLQGVQVNADLWSGSRTSYNAAEIVGAGDYGPSPEDGFRVSWVITPTVGGKFHYLYTFTDDAGGNVAKDVSHFILQVSDTFDYSNFVSIAQGALKQQDLKTYIPGENGNSNPELPASIFGAKFDPPAKVNGKQYIEFVSTRAPMWGNFYVKSGNGTHAWNLGLKDPTADLAGFIAVPDTVEVIPEPIFLQMGSLLTLGGLGIRRMRKLI